MHKHACSVHKHKLTQNDLDIAVNPAPHTTSKKNKSVEWEGATGEAREREGAPGGKGENGSACSFYFPLFHRGPPIDRSSAQIHQQMLELTVSFNHGNQKKRLNKPPLALSASSLRLCAF